MKLAWCLGVMLFVACGDDGTAGTAGSGAGASGSGASGSGASGAGGSGSGASGSGASGSGASGAGASGAGGSGAGGTGAAGTGGAGADLSECDTAMDCPQGQNCVELVTGYRVCQAQIIPATGCDSKLDECCDSGDCEAGQLCLEVPLVPFCGGIQMQPYNTCGAPQCVTNADCTDGAVCAPPGTFGNKVAACLASECVPGCSCGVVREPCCNQVSGLFCIIDCQSTADCGAGEYCQAGECIVGDILCPA